MAQPLPRLFTKFYSPSRFASNAVRQPAFPKRTFCRDLSTIRFATSSSKSHIQHNAANSEDVPSQEKVLIRKAARNQPGKTSLRRVAVEAQRSQNAGQYRENFPEESHGRSKVTAVCVADQFDMKVVVGLLRSHGFTIDTSTTGFLPEQVVHSQGVNNGDVFVFPSGCVVGWSLPEDVVLDLAAKTLFPAALAPHVDQVEIEDFEFQEDPARAGGTIKGDIITLGTGQKQSSEGNPSCSREIDTTLAKIAFSSGLARSTKLAVLETKLGKYIDSTRSMTKLLSRGSRLPFSRGLVQQRTGELLELRAQLNHYSELTDSLPDLFWDSKHELGLEGYFDMVGKALDVNVRIKTLNEKMDYAQEIAGILRELTSQKHSTKLEWIIIALIAIEVVFGSLHLWREYRIDRDHDCKERYQVANELYHLRQLEVDRKG